MGAGLENQRPVDRQGKGAAVGSCRKRESLALVPEEGSCGWVEGPGWTFCFLFRGKTKKAGQALCLKRQHLREKRLCQFTAQVNDSFVFFLNFIVINQIPKRAVIGFVDACCEYVRGSATGIETGCCRATPATEGLLGRWLTPLHLETPSHPGGMMEARSIEAFFSRELFTLPSWCMEGWQQAQDCPLQ